MFKKADTYADSAKAPLSEEIGNGVVRKIPFLLRMGTIIFLFCTIIGTIPAIVLFIIRLIKYPEARGAARKSMGIMLSILLASLVCLFILLGADGRAVRKMIKNGDYVAALNYVETHYNPEAYSYYSTKADVYVASGDYDAAANSILEYCNMASDLTSLRADATNRLSKYRDNVSEDTAALVDTMLADIETAKAEKAAREAAEKEAREQAKREEREAREQAKREKQEAAEREKAEQEAREAAARAEQGNQQSSADSAGEETAWQPPEVPAQVHREQGDYTPKTAQEIHADLYYADSYNDYTLWSSIAPGADHDASLDYVITNVEILDANRYEKQFSSGNYSIEDAYDIQITAESEYAIYSNIFRAYYDCTRDTNYYYELRSVKLGTLTIDPSYTPYTIKKMPPDSFAKKYYEQSYYLTYEYDGISEYLDEQKRTLIDAEIETIKEGIYPVCLANATYELRNEEAGYTDIAEVSNACVFYDGYWRIRNNYYSDMDWNAFYDYFDDTLKSKLYDRRGQYEGYTKVTRQYDPINTIYYDIAPCSYMDLNGIAITLRNVYVQDGVQYYDELTYYSLADITYSHNIAYGFGSEAYRVKSDGSPLPSSDVHNWTVIDESKGTLSQADALEYIREIAAENEDKRIFFSAEEFLYDIYGDQYDKYYIDSESSRDGLTYIAYGRIGGF